MDLKETSGLPLSLENGKIALSEGVISLPESQRLLEEARPYLMDESAIFGLNWLYTMNRGVHFESDSELFKEKGLRYDITNMVPGTVGKEFVKTIGHYHKDSSSEVYEVLSGKALFLFQEISRAGKVYLIKVEAGQKIVIPPGFGHITVNIGEGNLVVSDISSVDMDPDYDFFKRNRGAAYYAIKADGGFETIKNGNYPETAELKIGRPKEIPELEISFSKPLYESFVENPEKFDFIRNPEKYEKNLLPENLFEFSA